MSNNFLPALTNSDTGFIAYLKKINKIPSLDEEEEFRLAKLYQEHSDLNAAHKLVSSYLKLVAKVAFKYKNYGLPIVDLVSEGNIGLMQAVKKFDYLRGYRLSTYAIWWIKASIQEYILKSWSLVKIGTTTTQKKLFFNLGKLKRKISLINSRDFSYQDFQQVADELNVPLKDVAEMNVRMSHDFYLDEPLKDEGGSSYLDIVPSNSPSHELVLASRQEAQNKKILLANALEELSERERDIINKRKLQEKPETLDNLSNFYKVSKERVRQIEEKAMKKLSSFILGSRKSI